MALLILIHLYQNEDFCFLGLSDLNFLVVSAGEHNDQLCTEKMKLADSHSCACILQDRGNLTSLQCRASPDTCPQTYDRAADCRTPAAEENRKGNNY